MLSLKKKKKSEREIKEIMKRGEIILDIFVFFVVKDCRLKISVCISRGKTAFS